MILFLRLLFAHLLADFLFQPTSWVVDKNERKIRSVKLFYHIVVVTALSILFTLDYFSWQIPVFIFVFHYLIDLIKIYFKPSVSNNLTWFLFDQFLHLLLIFWISTLLDDSLQTVSCEIWGRLSFPDTFVYLISYFLIVWPSMVVVNLATKEWQKQIAESGEPNLSNAGKWIGVLERLLVLTFVLGGTISGHWFSDCSQINSSNIGEERRECPNHVGICVGWNFDKFHNCSVRRHRSQSDSAIVKKTIGAYFSKEQATQLFLTFSVSLRRNNSEAFPKISSKSSL